MHVHSTGNKHDELEICVHLQGHNLAAITETLWDGLLAIPAACKLTEVVLPLCSALLGSPIERHVQFWAPQCKNDAIIMEKV